MRCGKRDTEYVALARSAEHAHADGSIADEWRIGDQYDLRTQTELVAGTDAVIQAAIDWEALNQGPVLNFERNVFGSLRLLEAARVMGVKQFLFVSSLDVYHEILADRPLDENHPAWPGSLYGAYKAAVELHIKAYHTAYGINASTWRPATMYGLHHQPRKSLWFDLVQAVKEGREVSTDAYGQIVHVEDVADALALAIGDESVAGEIYNLVDCDLEWRETVDIAKKLTGSTSRIQAHPNRTKKLAFDSAKAVAFFNRHGNKTALRRGREGVIQYASALLSRV